MATVYLARDLRHDRLVALKVLNPEIAADGRTIERFRNELKTARQISHKNVCRMHELHQDGKQLFITMEYVPGQDLKGLIKEGGAMPAGKAISIAKLEDGSYEAVVDLDRCLFCGQCVDSCPKEALACTEDFELAGSQRDKLRVAI